MKKLKYGSTIITIFLILLSILSCQIEERFLGISENDYSDLPVIDITSHSAYDLYFEVNGVTATQDILFTGTASDTHWGDGGITISVTNEPFRSLALSFSELITFSVGISKVIFKGTDIENNIVSNVFTVEVLNTNFSEDKSFALWINGLPAGWTNGSFLATGTDFDAVSNYGTTDANTFPGSVKLDWTGDGLTPHYFYRTNELPVTPGDVIYAEISTKDMGGTVSAKISVKWLSAIDALVGESIITPLTNHTPVWTVNKYADIVPAGAVKGHLVIEGSSAASAHSLLLDDYVLLGLSASYDTASPVLSTAVITENTPYVYDITWSGSDDVRLYTVVTEIYAVSNTSIKLAFTNTAESNTLTLDNVSISNTFISNNITVSVSLYDYLWRNSTAETEDFNYDLSATQTSSLFFCKVSTVRQGSANWAEIFNGTGASVNLGDYAIHLVTNGIVREEYLLTPTILTNGGTWIIGRNGASTINDQNANLLTWDYYNGACKLANISGGATNYEDSFFNEDLTIAFSQRTKFQTTGSFSTGYTVYRKPEILIGNTSSWVEQTTDTNTSEWIIMSNFGGDKTTIGNISDIGSHTVE